MAKNISLLGANYPNVPAVQLPQTGGGVATFYDITDYSTGTITRHSDTGSGGTLSQLQCYKIGKTVCVGAKLTGVSLACNLNYFVLPEGFRPKVKTYAIGCFYTNAYIPFVYSIDTGGVVGLAYGSPIASEFYFSATFPVE